jgi:uncharacterized protein (DUF983 family)
MGKSLHKTSFLANITGIVRNKCPHCKKGNIYKHQDPFQLSGFMEMNSHCPHCGLRFVRETDFYDGATYISYGLSISIAFITFLIWWLVIGFSFYDDRVFGWLGLLLFILIILQPPIMRFSRTAWLWFFDEYYYDNKSGPRMRKKRMFRKFNQVRRNISRDEEWNAN